jgi:hypothetical protein
VPVLRAFQGCATVIAYAALLVVFIIVLVAHRDLLPRPSQMYSSRVPGWGGAGMSEVTQEDALRQADVLVGQALRETEGRCAVLGQYIGDCDRNGSRTAAWSEALRELHALHVHRDGLLRRRSLIQQALDCPVGESPASTPLVAPRDRTAVRTQQQVRIQTRRRS